MVAVRAAGRPVGLATNATDLLLGDLNVDEAAMATRVPNLDIVPATVDLSGATTAALELQGRYNIEEDYDYMYFEVSTDGTTWTPVDGTVNGEPFSRTSGDPAVTGSSEGQWVDMQVPLDALAGKEAQLRFRSKTDGATYEAGFFADEITITADYATIKAFFIDQDYTIGMQAYMAGKLGELDIPVQANYRASGTHSWPYWQREFKNSWPMLASALGARGMHVAVHL